MSRTREERQAYYQANKARAAETHRLLVLRNAEYVKAAKTNKPCVDCGVIYPPYVLDFDHVTGEKIDRVSRLVQTSSIERIQEEIDKCVLRCANCHRERTFNPK